MQPLNKDINIFVCTHKPFYFPKSDFFKPIFLSNYQKTSTFQKDNVGDNISDLNPYFCEMTGIYWAWKNVQCEYYGFMHYRRYFCFNEQFSDSSIYSLNDQCFKNFCFNDNEKISKIIHSYDLILPKKMILKDNNYNFYLKCKGHEISDLDFALKEIESLHPECKKAIRKFKTSKSGYYCNSFIMKKSLFNEYCEWIFPILFKLHKQKNYKNSSLYNMRSVGFVAERLLNIFIIWKSSKYHLKIKELPLVNIIYTKNPYLSPTFNNKSAICFASNDHYAKHLGLAIHSLILNSNKHNNYDIIILDDDITDHRRKIIKKMSTPNISIRFLPANGYISCGNLYEKQHIKKTCYLRFASIDLLWRYEKIIYFDCDVIFNHDVADLYHIDISNFLVGAVKDPVMAMMNNDSSYLGIEQRNYNKTMLGFTDENIFDYFNSGVLIINTKEFRNHKIDSNYLFKLALSQKWDWQDQDILNYVCKGKTLFLNSKWNTMALFDINPEEETFPYFVYKDYKRALDDPYIIHYAGHQQPPYNPYNTKFSELYWKYARTSPFYEELLIDLNQTIFKLKKCKEGKNTLKYFIKKLFPSTTGIGRLLRKIYHKLKKC